MNYKPTEYGFEFGSATITRLAVDAKTGLVVLGVRTHKVILHINITKTGKITVYRDGEVME